MSIATPAASATHTKPASEPPEREFSDDELLELAFSTIVELGCTVYDLHDFTTPIHQIDSILKRGPRRTLNLAMDVYAYLKWDTFTRHDALKFLQYLRIYTMHNVSRDVTTGEVQFTRIEVTADRPHRRHLLTRLQDCIAYIAVSPPPPAA